MKDLWLRIRQARQAAGLTQQDIAEALQVKRAAVSQWEAPEAHKRTAPKLEHLVAVAKLTYHSVGWLLGEDQRSPNTIGEQQRAYGEIIKIPCYALSDTAKRIKGKVQQSTLLIDQDLSEMLGKQAFATRLEDNALSPVLNRGDYVVIEPELEVEHGDYVLVKLHKHKTPLLRQYLISDDSTSGQPVVELKANQRNVVSITFNANRNNRIIGVLLEHRRRY